MKILKVGNFYYYAKNSVHFKCVSVGKITSVFVDNNKVNCIFYNEDVYITSYKEQLRRKKIKKIYENMVN